MRKQQTFSKINGYEIDLTTKYSDEFYKEFISNFEKNTKRKLFYKVVKRAIDVAGSLLAIILLSPLLICIAIAIKIDSKGPVVFKQKRLGKNNKPFMLYKFRSMKIETPHDIATSVLQDADSHCTRVGKFLRKTSLDEFMQFFNILKGDMSFIGYRPLILAEENCNNMRQALGVFEMRPGISGYAQVHGRDGVYYKNKAIMDAYYVKNAGFMLDVRLFFETIKVVLFRDGNES